MMKASQMALFFNQLMKADKYAIQTLMKFGVSCNDALASCPCLPVRQVAEGYLVGPLGLINGILLESGEQEVVVMSTDATSGKLLGFTTVDYKKMCGA